MRVFLLFFSLIIGLIGFTQKSEVDKDFVQNLEKEIVFNDYLTDDVRIEKINNLIIKASKTDFETKEIFLKYAQVTLSSSKNKENNDEALYQFVELTEICDTTKEVELNIYLGSILQISDILRNNSAFELSYEYVKKGIDLIERKNLKDYLWIQDFYNNAGVDLLTMGDHASSQIALNKALIYSGNKDYLQAAMIEFNLSFLNYELSNLDSAIYHQENTRAFFEKIEDLDSYPEIHGRYGNSIGSLALFYYWKNDKEKAKSMAVKAQSIFKKIGFFDGGAYPYLFTLINLAIENDDTDQINKLLIEIEDVTGKVEKGRFNFYHLISESYKQIGNPEQENKYLNLAYARSEEENGPLISKLQKYNSKLQSQILEREKARFQNEKEEYNRKATSITVIISLILLAFIAILYVLYTKVRNRKDLLEKEKEISKIEYERNEMKTKLTESELNEKRLINNRLASHIKLKQQTESAFLQKIKELKRKEPQNIESAISELQVKMMNLVNIDPNFEHHLQVNDLNEGFRAKLKLNHPNLNEKELQFCSYLLLNLSAKEIGSITNQSDGATRVYKNRLKKKILGQQEIDFVSYLQNI